MNKMYIIIFCALIIHNELNENNSSSNLSKTCCRFFFDYDI